MEIKLFNYSQINPILLIEDDIYKNAATLEDMVAYCARVSNPSNQFNSETTDRLLKYLMTHAHWSPFEMVSMCMEINTTRDIAHQIIRHRSFSFQEFSQRYAKPSDMTDWPFVVRETRLQDPKNRQNSIELDLDDIGKGGEDMIGNSDEWLAMEWERRQREVIDTAKAAYDWAIEHNIAKEQARVVLPEGNTKSRLYMNGTLRSWIHYCELRGANGTQKEHMVIAKTCAEIIAEQFPLILDLV